MSSFSGKIIEISDIAVDRFDEDNRDKSMYFLSHMHTDHMTGLNNIAFQHKLVADKKLLYCSNITKLYLEVTFPIIKAKLRALSLSEPTLIKYNEHENLTVTLFPAGHCPGSVMFLFNFENNNILYTGDFRICNDDIKKFKHLHSKCGNPIPIHKMYLDTTFLNIDYKKFPSRKECSLAICNSINIWIEEEYLIFIKRPALYGSENLFLSIHDILKLKIHVSEAEYRIYKNIPEMKAAITLNGAETPIHACVLKGRICRSNERLKTLKPCALSFAGYDLSKSFRIECGYETKMFYSSHSSYEEIKYFIQYLRPNYIHPCVLPKDDPEATKTMHKLIENMMAEYKEQPNSQLDSSSEELLTDVQKASKFDHSSQPGSDCDSLDEFEFPKSPPRKRRRDLL